MRHPYASLAYAETLRHVGRPVDVPDWGATAIVRDIPGAPGQIDAMGAYPLCVLAPDAHLAAGLDHLRSLGAVSVVLVADPIAGPGAATLRAHLPLCRPFKTHYLVDRNAGPDAPSKHHRDRIRRGERHASARVVTLQDPAWRQTWCSLYAGLVRKKGITGLQAFPPASLDRLSQMAALTAFAAESSDGDVLAMQLWIRHGDCAYSHLTATSEMGYRLGATYVTYAAAIEHFADCRVLDLGGGAGALDDPNDSLAAFKRGFANATDMTLLCGAVLDQPAYDGLAAERRNQFFPAYRGPIEVRQAA